MPLMCCGVENMSRIRPNIAQQRIKSFEKRFGKAHLYFAHHAAFPLALTPDLLYRLWVNFQLDINGEIISIPWIAVADLLLSSLCHEVGHELYEMDIAVRNELLKQLKANEKFGQKRINELSDFLLGYVKQQLQSDDPDIRDFAHTQRWTALAYTHPSEVARELALAFLQLKENNTLELMRMASLTNTFAEPLAEFQPLLTYGCAMGHFAYGNLESATTLLDGLLTAENEIFVAGVNLPIPKHIKANLRQNLKNPFSWDDLSANFSNQQSSNQATSNQAVHASRAFLKNWKTTAIGIILLFTGFVAFSPNTFGGEQSPFVQVCKYITSGGLAALGICSMDFDASRGFLKNWKTTAIGITLSFTSFVALSPSTFGGEQSPLVQVCKYITSGGLAALGVCSMDFDASRGFLKN
jgi:hypothetical protein